jgi:hypothetical protein
MIHRLALLLLIAPCVCRAECPGAGRLEEALALVGQAHPVLQADRDSYAEQRRQRPWDVSLAVGYSITDTFESGDAGPNAAIRVRIPLWDRTSELQAAKDKAAAVAKEDATRAALIADIQALCAHAHQVRALGTARQFNRDRLTYRQERVDQGIDPADSLWSEAEAFQNATHTWEQEAAKLDTTRLTLARRYGGEEWVRLQALFEAMTP